MERIHKDEIEQFYSALNKESNHVEKTKEEKSDEIDEREEYTMKLEQEGNMHRMNAKKLKGEIEELKETYKKEMQLRLKFEYRINSVHSAHKVLQTKV